MATQPLQTIPKETPARVTADPPKTKPATEKNPGRVASGKRLAERNRLAREAKKKAEASTSATQASTATPAQSENTNTETPSSSSTTVTMLMIGGLVVSALGVYYQRETIRSRLRPAPPAPAPAPAPTPAQPEPTPTMSLIPVKQGVRKMK